MRTIRCSGHLSCHTCPLLLMPPAMHALLLHMPPHHACPLCHACPPAMHDPCRACLPSPCHACPLPRMLLPPTMHPPAHTCPPPCHTHPPCLPCTPPLWTEWLTDRGENITFPQLRLRTVKIFLSNSSTRCNRSLWISSLKKITRPPAEVTRHWRQGEC